MGYFYYNECCPHVPDGKYESFSAVDTHQRFSFHISTFFGGAKVGFGSCMLFTKDAYKKRKDHYWMYIIDFIFVVDIILNFHTYVN